MLGSRSRLLSTRIRPIRMFLAPGLRSDWKHDWERTVAFGTRVPDESNTSMLSSPTLNPSLASQAMPEKSLLQTLLPPKQTPKNYFTSAVRSCNSIWAARVYFGWRVVQVHV